VLHLLQLLVKVLLNLERGVADNSKLVGSLLIGGLWLLFLAWIFAAPLGDWRDCFFWSGWILIGLAAFLFVRRKLWAWQGGRARIAKRGPLFRL
jgi:hypothetical protein